MARFEVFAGVQPYEEQQSPVKERSEPTDFQLALQRTRSTSVSSPPPASPTQTLHRIVSGDPESPPPAWTRRPSLNNRKQYPSSDTSSSLPGSPPGLASHSSQQAIQVPPRRHYPPPPNLQMTRAMQLQSRPRSALPPPSFRGRRPGVTSNRSSMASFDGMNSEELWALEDDPTPDLSNPTRASSERPLDTVRRISQRVEYASGLPADIIWPSAPPEMPEYMQPPHKSRSMTSMASTKKRNTLRKSSSRSTTFDSPTLAPQHTKDLTSSAHSSTTSLSIPVNKSHSSLSSRPQSIGYGFDLMSTLAPREGGYAIAAQLASNQNFSPTSSSGSDERRQYPSPPNSYRASRGPPSARSSGMRWSVGPTDELTPPAPGRVSSNSTSSNLSAMAVPDDDFAPPPAIASAPSAPSPLSQHTTADDVAPSVPTSLASAPVSAAPSPIKPKSKKDIKAEEKARAKAAKEEARIAAEEAKRRKADAARQAAEAKQKAKADAVRQKEEDKARAKAAKRESKLVKAAPVVAAGAAAAAAARSTPSPRPTPARVPSNSAVPTVAASPRPSPARIPSSNSAQNMAAMQVNANQQRPAPIPAHGHAPNSMPPGAAAPMPQPMRANSSIQPVRQPAPQMPATPPRATPSPSATPRAQPQPQPQPRALPTPPLISVQDASSPRPESRERTNSSTGSHLSATPSGDASSRTSSSTTQTSKTEKKGLLSSMKRRFSMASMSTPAAPQPPPKPRHEPVNGSAGSGPVIAPRGSSLRPEVQAPMPTPQAPSEPAAPSMPVVVPPRASSLTTTGYGSPMTSPELEHHRQPSLSNPSSVIVTPTTSMATNSSPSLFELQHPAPAFRDRADSLVSGNGSCTTGAYSSAVSEADEKEMEDRMHLAAPTVAAH